MFVGWYLGLIGGIFMCMIHCEDSDPSSIENEPEVKVVLTVNTRPKSDIDAINSLDDQTAEPFACHECTNCNQKSDIRILNCESGINMCYTINKRINNINQIIRRGCSTSKTACTAPDDQQSNSFDSITCCNSQKCNQGIQLKSLFLLLILNLFIIMITI